MKTQIIVAVRSDTLGDVAARSGFHPFEDGELFERLTRAGLWLGPRYLLEEDDRFRQIIPYVVLRYEGRIACYRRTVAGGEGRLHGKGSIGFGGHIEAEDVAYEGQRIDARRTVEAGAAREVREEVGDVHVVGRRWRGLLIENDSSVGRVHLGVVGEWTVASSELTGAEDAVTAVRFETPEQIVADEGGLESWSTLCLPALRRSIATSRRARTSRSCS